MAKNIARRQADLTGKVIWKLTVIREFDRQDTHRRWLCRCECGTEKVVWHQHLTSGRITKSCGCILKEAVGNAHRSHGKSHSREYHTWWSMRQRCEYPNHPSYGDYGGRGVRVCERWKVFANFYADMGDRPQGMTLDRIDPNGDYEPGKCRWANSKLQQRNKRSNRFLTIDDETLPLVSWAERYHMNPETVSYRIRHGWDLKAALETSPGVPKGTTLLNVKNWRMFDDEPKPNHWHHVPHNGQLTLI